MVRVMMLPPSNAAVSAIPLATKLQMERGLASPNFVL
jgi:hypothetical protein